MPTFEKCVPRLLLVVRRRPRARKRVWEAEGAPVSLAFFGEKNSTRMVPNETKRNGTVQEPNETLSNGVAHGFRSVFDKSKRDCIER